MFVNPPFLNSVKIKGDYDEIEYLYLKLKNEFNYSVVELINVFEF